MRIAIPSDLKEKWDGMIEARGISQQRAVVALVRWIIEQDPLVQLMIFGQAPAQDHAQLIKLVLDRLEDGTTCEVRRVYHKLTRLENGKLPFLMPNVFAIRL